MTKIRNQTLARVRKRMMNRSQESEILQSQETRAIDQQSQDSSSTTTVKPPYVPDFENTILSKDDLFPACLPNMVMTPETATQMSDILNAHTCQFCEVKTFSAIKNLKRHYLTCPALKKLEEDGSVEIPNDIKQYRHNQMLKQHERREAVKRKLEEEGPTATSEICEPKKLRKALNEIPTTSFPAAYWPCRHCMLPLSTQDKLANHLVYAHGYAYEEAKN